MKISYNVDEGMPNHKSENNSFSLTIFC